MMRKALHVLACCLFAHAAYATPLTAANARLTTTTLYGVTTLVNGNTSIPLTPWNWDGYNALSVGSSAYLTFSRNGANSGIGYTNTSDSLYSGLLIARSGWAFFDKGIFLQSQSSPASGDACDQGAMTVDSSYLYYCVSANRWGRIPWQTGY